MYVRIHQLLLTGLAYLEKTQNNPIAENWPAKTLVKSNPSFILSLLAKKLNFGKTDFWESHNCFFESAGAQSVTKLSPGLLTFTNKQSSTPRSLLQTDFIWSKDLPTEHISKLLYFLFHFYDLNLIAEVDDD